MTYRYASSGLTVDEYREDVDSAYRDIPADEQPAALSDWCLTERIADLAYLEAELGGRLGRHADRYLTRMLKEAVRRHLARDLPFEAYKRL